MRLRMALKGFTALVLLIGLATPALAQAPDPGVRTGPYLGVQPGQKDYAPGKVDVTGKGGLRLLTWVGFQMVGPGGRVFLQTNQPPVYELVPGNPDEIVLELPDTRLHRRNDGRPLKTGYFPTAVSEVRAKKIKGNRTRITIKLRETVGYDLRQEGNYLILDFRAPTQPLAAPPVR